MDYEFYNTLDFTPTEDEILTSIHERLDKELDDLINEPLTYGELYEHMNWLLSIMPKEKYDRKVYRWYKSQFVGRKRG